jgi:hypothetical protein
MHLIAGVRRPQLMMQLPIDARRRNNSPAIYSKRIFSDIF